MKSANVRINTECVIDYEIQSCVINIGNIEINTNSTGTGYCHHQQQHQNKLTKTKYHHFNTII